MTQAASKSQRNKDNDIRLPMVLLVLSLVAGGCIWTIQRNRQSLYRAVSTPAPQVLQNTTDITVFPGDRAYEFKAAKVIGSPCSVQGGCEPKQATEGN